MLKRIMYNYCMDRLSKPERARIIAALIEGTRPVPHLFR
jgi:hypothetical protein